MEISKGSLRFKVHETTTTLLLSDVEKEKKNQQLPCSRGAINNYSTATLYSILISAGFPRGPSSVIVPSGENLSEVHVTQ